MKTLQLSRKPFQIQEKVDIKRAVKPTFQRKEQRQKAAHKLATL